MSNVKIAKHGMSRFAFGMLIYAVVFLLIAAVGLAVLWNFMEEYEYSRPKTAINAYMQSLTEEHICDLSQELVDQVDHNIQTQQQCHDFIMDAIGEISYAKKAKGSSADRQVFVLQTEGSVIGEFTIAAGEEGKYGFKPWVLEKESFDLTALNLFGSAYQTIVPSDHTVTVNGYVLDEQYITNAKIPYEPIEDYYEDYDIPYRVCYTVKPVFGEMEVVITDPDGNEMTFDENTDWTPYFHNCTMEEKEMLDAFASEYVERYTSFTGSVSGSRYVYYRRLMEYVMPDTDFADRLREAIEGLAFGQTQGNKVVSVTTHHQVRLAEDKYLLDVTYEVDTIGYKGAVRTTTNARIIAVRTEQGLKAESMSVY